MTITVETLIVTLCSGDRRESILRAIESAQSQPGAAVMPVIVINGQRYDPDFRAQLEARDDIRVHYLTEGNLFAARKFARESVTAAFFCWLDDDDIFLPGAIERRLKPLREDPRIDAVISNGFIREGSDQELLFDGAEVIERDPVAALFGKNWLAAAGGLFRTATISPDYFDASVRSLDMTYLALRLATEKEIRFLNEPTFRKNRSEGSLSTTDAWMLPARDTLQSMFRFPLNMRSRRMLRKKIGAALHDLSDYYRRAGDETQAWHNHLSSLASPGGLWRYGVYTRRLLFLSLRRAVGRLAVP
jgi:glycosyltransferase involved in cell wall biosynthesis